MTDQLQRDIQRAWILALIDAWQRIRYATPGLTKLKLPNFAIDKRQATLGTWHPERRQICLAARLFQRADWHLVEAVLKHEMAHQIAGELGNGARETDHGPAFRAACEMLRIDPAATLQLVGEDGPDLPKIVAKIQKLFALGESTNTHEAEQALAKAHELLLKYNIKQLDELAKPGYSFRIVSAPMRRTPNYLWAIANIVSEFYFVQYISQQFSDANGQLGGGRFRVIEFYGTTENLDLAEYVFHFLLNRGELEWRRYKLTNRLRNNTMKRSFLNGLYAGFKRTLAARRKEMEDAHALVWLGDPALETYYRGRNPSVRTRSTGARLDPSVHADGVGVGEKLRIDPGLGQQAATSRGRRLEGGG